LILLKKVVQIENEGVLPVFEAAISPKNYKMPKKDGSLNKEPSFSLLESLVTLSM